MVCFDDDAMATNCVERLLARASEERFEVVYGRTTVHLNGPPDVVIGAATVQEVTPASASRDVFKVAASG